MDIHLIRITSELGDNYPDIRNPDLSGFVLSESQLYCGPSGPVKTNPNPQLISDIRPTNQNPKRNNFEQTGHDRKHPFIEIIHQASFKVIDSRPLACERLNMPSIHCTHMRCICDLPWLSPKPTMAV